MRLQRVFATCHPSLARGFSWAIRHVPQLLPGSMGPRVGRATHPFTPSEDPAHEVPCMYWRILPRGCGAAFRALSRRTGTGYAEGFSRRRGGSPVCSAFARGNSHGESRRGRPRIEEVDAHYLALSSRSGKACDRVFGDAGRTSGAGLVGRHWRRAELGWYVGREDHGS